MSKDPYTVVKHPLVTEKSMQLSALNQYVFEVESKANKIEIAQAVHDIFDVKVVKVRTLNSKPEQRAYGSKARQRKARKKAIVTLAEGHEIDLTM